MYFVKLKNSQVLVGLMEAELRGRVRSVKQDDEQTKSQGQKQSGSEEYFEQVFGNERAGQPSLAADVDNPAVEVVTELNSEWIFYPAVYLPNQNSN